MTDATNRQQATTPAKTMRPNIGISHALNGEVKDYAADHDIAVDEAYRRIITRGLEELQREESAGGSQSSSGDESAATWPDESVLDGVYTHRTDTDARRAIGMHVLNWMSSRDGQYTASEIKDALYEEEHREGENADTWWTKNAKPALTAAADVGLVDWQKGGKHYAWNGE